VVGVKAGNLCADWWLVKLGRADRTARSGSGSARRGAVAMNAPREHEQSNDRGDNGQRGRWADKQIFTTGEAAKVCNVSQQTIIRCFDSGRLGGFRVPGSKFRRIPRHELIRFMQANGIPLTSLETGKRRVLIVDDDEEILEVFADALQRDDRFEAKTASTGYDAGLLTESFRPHVILLDFMLPDINGDVVCERIGQNPELAETKIIFISGVVDQREIDRLLKAGADDFFKKPLDINKLIERIGELVGV